MLGVNDIEHSLRFSNLTYLLMDMGVSEKDSKHSHYLRDNCTLPLDLGDVPCMENEFCLMIYLSGMVMFYCYLRLLEGTQLQM